MLGPLDFSLPEFQQPLEVLRIHQAGRHRLVRDQAVGDRCFAGLERFVEQGLGFGIRLLLEQHFTEPVEITAEEGGCVAGVGRERAHLPAGDRLPILVLESLAFARVAILGLGEVGGGLGQQPHPQLDRSEQ